MHWHFTDNEWQEVFMAVMDAIIHGTILHMETFPPPNGGGWFIELTYELPASFES